jgi:xanthine/uracil permease
LLQSVPDSLRILAGDGIVVGTVTAILLNLLLPRERAG